MSQLLIIFRIHIPLTRAQPRRHRMSMHMSMYLSIYTSTHMSIHMPCGHVCTHTPVPPRDGHRPAHSRLALLWRVPCQRLWHLGAAAHPPAASRPRRPDPLFWGHCVDMCDRVYRYGFRHVHKHVCRHVHRHVHRHMHRHVHRHVYIQVHKHA